MKRILPIFQIGLGVIALVGLIIVLNALFQSRTAETGARQTPTGVAGVATREATREGKPTPKPTKKAKVNWEDATLDQIKFRKGHSVLTHDGWMKIWSWLPDNRHLLLELEDKETKDNMARFRIVTLDTKTGEIVEYGRRADDNTPPYWIEQTQSIVFRYWNTHANKPPEIHVANAKDDIRKLDAQGLAGITVEPTTGDIYFLLYKDDAIPLQLIESRNAELTARTPFASLSFPAGRPIINVQGQSLAVLGYKDVPIVRLNDGSVQMYHIADAPQESGPLVPRSGIWSPSGNQIAISLGEYGVSGGLLVGTQLYLLLPETGHIQPIHLPAQFVMEFEWSPRDRFLIARGTPRGLGMNQAETFWLVDSSSGEFKELPDFLKAFFPEETFMAWSNNGKMAWIHQDNIMISNVRP